MAFERPISIKEALDNIQGKRYAMPAIQREFVWSVEQIERLFDSLMQDYPIGAFLFWRVEPETVGEYRWYGFMRDYHEKDRTHNDWFEPLDNTGGFTAVLDGQQRLTALNIGLRGSYAEKLPRLHWSNPDAYPKQELFLNIASELEDDESGLRYEFKFMAPHSAEEDGGKQKWFRVSDIMGMDTAAAVFEYMINNGLMHNINDDSSVLEKKEIQGRITRLWQAIHVDAPISFYLEPAQDLEKVLNIFIRTNSGGTVLSNSDLLLSIATAQWHDLDAREEVNERTDSLNKIGDGFDFPRDFVLRAGFVLADIGDVGFHVRNFNSENMHKLEVAWEKIMGSLHTAVALADEFGLSGGRLDSQNALIPVAYYIHQKGHQPDFIERTAYQADRDRIREWLFRTLIGRVWGGSSDTILARMRSEMRGSTAPDFPSEALSSALSAMGRSVSFDDEQLEEVVDTRHGPRAYVLLAMLYPELNVGEYNIHMDHFFPRKFLTVRSLVRSGFPDPEVREIRARMNQLPNLVLLRGRTNVSKGATMPAEWLCQHFKTDSERKEFLRFHDLGVVPNNVAHFVDWYEARRKKMLEKLRKLIGRK